MAPFGVRVVNVITGGVKSSLSRIERKLPADSLYLPIVEMYEKRQKYAQVVAIPAEEYAKAVVQKVLYTQKNTLWEGAKAWQAWFATSYLPKSFMASTVNPVIWSRC